MKTETITMQGCTYCDSTMGAHSYCGEYVCISCGADWEPTTVVEEVEYYDEVEEELSDAEHFFKTGKFR